MAVDVTLTTITTGYNLTKLNANFTAIANALADGVSRSGITPNTMTAALDMNSNKIINLAAPGNSNDAARLQDITDSAASLTTGTAVTTTIADSGAHYSSSNVEGALQEIFDTGIPATSVNVTDTDGYYTAINAETILKEIQETKSTGSTTARTLASHFADTYHIDDWGVTGDGSTDDSTKIQTAIDFVESVGGVLKFGPKVYAIATGLVVNSANVFLQGVGWQKFANVNASGATRYSQFGGTIFLWTGGLAGGEIMLQFAPPVTGPTLHGVGYDGIILDGDGKADYGLDIQSVQRGHFPFTNVAECVIRNIHIGVRPASTLDYDAQTANFTVGKTATGTNSGATGVIVADSDSGASGTLTFGAVTGTFENNEAITDDNGSPGAAVVDGILSGAWTSTDPRNTQHCEFTQMFSTSWLAAADAADGILLSGDTVANVNFCHFGEIFYIHDDGIGLEITGGDTLEFQAVYGNNSQAGTGVGVQITGSAAASGNPRKIHFNHMQLSPGGLTVSDGTVAPESIVIDSYSRGNGTPAPVIGAKSRVTFRTDDGLTDTVSGDASATIMTENKAKYINTAQNIYRLSVRGLDSANALGQYAGLVGGIVTNTAGAEAGALFVEVVVGGSIVSTNLQIQNGVKCGSPGGGFKGAGTINAMAVYDEDTLLTCYVFDQELDGLMSDAKWDNLVPNIEARVDRIDTGEVDEAGNSIETEVHVPEVVRIHEPMRRFRNSIGPLGIDLDDYANHWKTRRHLPAMPDEATFDPLDNLSIGNWTQRLVETVEVQAILIEKLNERLKTLENV